MAKWFKEHLGFKSAKASPPAPPRPDYRHCHAAAAAYQHAGSGAGYPSPAQPDILAAYKLQKELDFEDPYAAGANTPFSGAALSEVKYVSPKHRLIKVETLERSPSAGGGGGGGGGGGAGGGNSAAAATGAGAGGGSTGSTGGSGSAGGANANQAAAGNPRSPTSPAAEHEPKQDKVRAAFNLSTTVQLYQCQFSGSFINQ
ncbi:SH2 domain-containing adapter protein F-like isoform X4, partial [Clarias magur]